LTSAVNIKEICIIYLQAANSIYRNKIIWCLAQYNVTAYLIMLNELALINTRARFEINKNIKKSPEERGWSTTGRLL
jgi:hypothetical protein